MGWRTDRLGRRESRVASRSGLTRPRSHVQWAMNDHLSLYVDVNDVGRMGQSAAIATTPCLVAVMRPSRTTCFFSGPRSARPQGPLDPPPVSTA
jgi:hypothetical protein